MADTLTGRLNYAGERVALGTMRYKHYTITYKLDDEEKCQRTRRYLPVLEDLFGLNGQRALRVARSCVDSFIS